VGTSVLVVWEARDPCPPIPSPLVPAASSLAWTACSPCLMAWWPSLSPCLSCNLLISYVISFYVIAQFWLVHHRVFRRITGQREGLPWWNFAFLFTITFMPFTSNLVGKFSANPLAVDIFAVNLLAAMLATHLTLTYGHRKNLLTADADAAKYCWLLLAVAPRVAERWAGRRPAA
jgi:hypothetical protein